VQRKKKKREFIQYSSKLHHLFGQTGAATLYSMFAAAGLAKFDDLKHLVIYVEREWPVGFVAL
jgi:hypothetical protein